MSPAPRAIRSMKGLAALVRDTIPTISSPGDGFNETDLAAQVAQQLNELPPASQRRAIELLSTVFVHAVLATDEGSIGGPPITAVLREHITSQLVRSESLRV